MHKSLKSYLTLLVISDKVPVVQADEAAAVQVFRLQHNTVQH